MYSLPSTSQTWLPRPRLRNFGDTPSTNCDGAFDSVCVPAGITRVARSQRRSDSAIERVLTSARINPGVSRIGAPGEFPAVARQSPKVVEAVARSSDDGVVSARDGDHVEIVDREGALLRRLVGVRHLDAEALLGL